jgi:exodeoxyribonuclease-5
MPGIVRPRGSVEAPPPGAQAHSNGFAQGQAVALSEEQRAACAELLRFPKQVQTLGGYAGTGKSTVVKELHRLLPSFAVCAYTGKAAHLLREKGIADASTIHSLIYRRVEWEEWDEWKEKMVTRVEWVRKSHDELGKDYDGDYGFHGSYAGNSYGEFGCQGFIIDEASMVNEKLFDDLCSYGLRLIAVGDHGQLEPVEDRYDLMSEPDITLETLHRNAGEVARFAEHLRHRGMPWGWGRQAGRDGSQVTLLPSSALTDFDLLSVDQIICGYNATRVAINRRARAAHLGRLGKSLPDGHPDDSHLPDCPRLGCYAAAASSPLHNWPVAGDRVICLKNDHQQGLFNGMQGVAAEVSGRRMVFRSGGIDYPVTFVPEAWNDERRPKHGYRGAGVPFDYAYCVTCHKAQGDEWDVVAVIEERGPGWDRARWSYTAASRARKRLIWVEA